MSDDLWIVVPNWDKFQHYKRRNPPWIRVYTSLLSHEPFMRLADRHKGLLFNIWLLYASHNGQLPASPAYIAHQCGFPSEWELRRWRVAGEWLVSGDGPRVEDTVRARDLKALEQAEFVQFVASKPLALRPTRDRDRDIKNLRASTETRKPRSTSKRRGDEPVTEHRPYDKPKDIEKTLRTLIWNGAIRDQVDLEAELAGYHVPADSDLAATLAAVIAEHDIGE